MKDISILKEIELEDYDFQYFASSLGKIYRWTGTQIKEIKGWKHYCKRTSKVYMRYSLKLNGRYYNRYGHRLVLSAFARKPKKDEIARHGPNGSLDNRPEELTWGSHIENQTTDRLRDDNYYNRGKKSIQDFWEKLRDELLNTNTQAPF